jgi:5-methylcytosine-specific restriction enzyme subunit McrC
VRQLTLTEHVPTSGVRLTPEERDALRHVTTTINIVPSWEQPDSYELTPGSTIGVINLGDLAIEIRPKFAIDRVLFLLSYALDPTHWQALGFDFAEAESLVEAIIPGFVTQLHRALDRGPLRGYRVEESASTILRGRVRFSEQILRRYGIIPPIEVRYDEFTEDIEENRLLKAALDRLARTRIRSEDARRSLRVFGQALADVELAAYHPRHLPEILYTRLNRHYRPAITLAKLILRSTSFELQHGQIRASVFLVDMNEVFETFVVVALREALGLSERVFPQHAKGRSLFLDQAKVVRLEPDLSWWDGPRCTFVGDAKYKRVTVAGINHPDLYQLLAYTVATDLPGGLLVYAAGEGDPAAHRVTHLGKVLEVVPLDLRGGPREILAQVNELARCVRRLRSRIVGPRLAA